MLDHSCTRMGSRLLRDWLLRPPYDVDVIADRHRSVAELVDDPETLGELRDVLDDMPDLERLSARMALRQATPRELVALRLAAQKLPQLLAVLEGVASPLLERLRDGLDPLADMAAMLEERLAQEPPAVVGLGVIRAGCDAELDEQRQLARGGKEMLASIELAERERTGISTLKVRYNKVFGYYIEIGRSKSDLVPEDYERRQTLANSERFITAELKELENRILAAEGRANARERELFAALTDELAVIAGRAARSAAQVAVLDVLACFADRARQRGYCRPVVDGGVTLSIKEGRHPVLEVVQSDPPFVPNDCEMDPAERQIVLLTGPNMGGKSTYLRQVALIVLMAHAGSFVPAASASIPLTDRIFTRVGASDMLARGESTFMVEMTETANILLQATPRSLVILDEVGRGTATFDGLSLAWAIVEYLHESKEHAAKVLFATHYHELTDLARKLERLINCSMAVKEWQRKILFLHRVVDEPADRSYGIHVAQLAGVPEPVCRRAEEILVGLERHELNVGGGPAPSPAAGGGRQLELFRSSRDEISELLHSIDIDRLSPLEALNVLADLKECAHRDL